MCHYSLEQNSSADGTQASVAHPGTAGKHFHLSSPSTCVLNCVDEPESDTNTPASFQWCVWGRGGCIAAFGSPDADTEHESFTASVLFPTARIRGSRQHGRKPRGFTHQLNVRLPQAAPGASARGLCRVNGIGASQKIRLDFHHHFLGWLLSAPGNSVRFCQHCWQ